MKLYRLSVAGWGKNKRACYVRINKNSNLRYLESGYA